MTHTRTTTVVQHTYMMYVVCTMYVCDDDVYNAQTRRSVSLLLLLHDVHDYYICTNNNCSKQVLGIVLSSWMDYRPHLLLLYVLHLQRQKAGTKLCNGKLGAGLI